MIAAWLSALAAWTLQHPDLAFSGKVVMVFVLTTVADVIWTLYIANTNAGRARAAANYSGLIILFGAINTFSYVHDMRLVIPAACGAWLGAFLAVRRETSRKAKDHAVPHDQAVGA